jgi:iron complex transport system substrate-binding protein
MADPELEERLEPDITVLRLDVGPPLTYEEDTMKLAAVLERTEEARVFIDWYQARIKAVTERVHAVPDSEKPLVFDFYGGEWGMSDGPPYGTYGSENTWVGPMIGMAGGMNLCRDMPGDWIVVDPEYVITENPDVIIREVYSGVAGREVVGYEAISSGGLEAVYLQITKKSALDTTAAVQRGRVFVCDGNLIQSDWFIGLQYMAAWFHPDLFADLDPAAVHQEYLSRFQGLDFDVKKKGVFVYPE